ncbi:hypothetical protein [Chitinophaga barathri]|uniref:Uncharacterized protein n=1 Tax=Chitinophaga barathri TaxID=1647451 RepID=A0A3N4MD78_9BACT|nr:hypothetical protein [Chitinophaga barathri]RPD41882.1 hypothetical protein EG028_06890 [Chitinophaga barathri]
MMVVFFFIFMHALARAFGMPYNITGLIQFVISFVYTVLVMWGLFPDFPKWKAVRYELIIPLIYYLFTFWLVWGLYRIFGH